MNMRNDAHVIKIAAIWAIYRDFQKIVDFSSIFRQILQQSGFFVKVVKKSLIWAILSRLTARLIGIINREKSSIFMRYWKHVIGTLKSLYNYAKANDDRWRHKVFVLIKHSKELKVFVARCIIKIQTRRITEKKLCG